MHFVIDYFKGIFIGAGAILPGISSGVLCVAFGIYEKLIDSILDFFKDWKKNLRFLLPILLGGITGVFLLSNLLEYLFSYFPMQTGFSFLGLILGTVPILLKQANEKKGFRLCYLLYFLIALLITCSLLFLESHFVSSETVYCVPTFSVSFLLLSGFLMSIGVVVPGVSSTVILMLLGIYDVYLASISHLDLSILIPMGIGLCLGGFVFLKMIQFLLHKFPSETYYAILGFTLGAMPILYPGFMWNMTGLASLLCFFSCLLIGYYAEKKD